MRAENIDELRDRLPPLRSPGASWNKRHTGPKRCSTACSRAKRRSCPPTELIEVMNSLVVAVRRKRIDPDRIARFTEDLAALGIRIEPALAPAVWNTVLHMANKHR